MTALAIAAVAPGPFWPQAALAQQALPQGGTVASGSVSIGPVTGNGLTITQNSARAIVNWQSFSVGQPNTVTFVQPSASSAILNRVTGDTPSTIAGQIAANGQVFLVNPNGISITSSGKVQAAGGFVASTLDIRDDDFNAGRLTFSGSGRSAAIDNAGTIEVGRGGFAALLGGTVASSGRISVPLGRVGLGAAERATLDLTGDGFLQVAVPTGSAAGRALIDVSGRIAARGGRVELQAATVRQAVRDAVNVSGTVSARSVSGRNGAIVLGGGPGGRVTVSGRLAADGRSGAGRIAVSGHTVDIRDATLTARARDGTGGSLTVTGTDIAVTRSTLDASGATGGGTIRIGGDLQGGGTLERADTVTIDAATRLAANATHSGLGGTVIVWSDNLTRFAGTVSATGGATAGDGGFAEVSGKSRLDYTGFADLSAAHGRFGTLLLDPYDVTISTAADANQSGFTATGNNSIINVATLQAALAAANVTVTTGAGGAQSGDITVASPITWSANTSLTLQAARHVLVNADITATGTSAGLVLTPGAGGSYTLGAGTRINLPGASATLSIAGQNYTLIRDATALQNMSANLAGRYALATDIDATATSAWNAGAGFDPIGNATTKFTGFFDGLSHAITGLTINRPSQSRVGLFGHVDGSSTGARIANVSIAGGSIVGNVNVGALVGQLNYATIASSSASASVGGNGFIGGLVGTNIYGTIQDSNATGAVGGQTSAGGLVDWNYGTVRSSFAGGSVTITNTGQAGGLVGGNAGTVQKSYATGDVTGFSSSLVGGLAYANTGVIDASYASGRVSAVTAAGFVGNNFGTVTNSYWDTQTTGQATGIRTGTLTGATGLTSAQARTQASYTGFNFTNDWVMFDGTRPFLRSEWSRTITNAHQLQLMALNLGAAYTLGRDIDATETAAGTGMWGTKGFNPVGTSATPFTGTFDGLGRSITGLTINRPFQSPVGLFGRTNGAIIANVALAGGSITGGSRTGSLIGWANSGSVVGSTTSATVTGVNWVGGLIGTGDTTIQTSSATGNVAGFSSVGGLVGESAGIVSNSFATGAVTGNSTVGGLLGNSGAPVSNSYATGTVIGRSDQVGGLIGFSYATVQKSYATGTVIGGANKVGGLIGENMNTVDATYATGSVSGVGSVGGLVGWNTGTVTNSYWDTDTSGLATGIGGGTSLTGATALTNAQARTQASYTGFDFTSDWVMFDATRPFLRSEWTQTITNAHQLQLMALNLGAAYTLGRDVDATETASDAGMWGTKGFSPIGDAAAPYTGTFDGLGRSITGLTINRPSQSRVGLFGRTHVATVANVSLVGGAITGGSRTGSLIGQANGGTVTAASTSAAVAGTTLVGGLIGWNNGTVTKNSANGTVSGSTTVGGLIGYDTGAVTDSYATGAVTGASSVGGLIGESAAMVTNSYAMGAVTGTGDDVGGLMGTSSGTVQTSYATGTVTGGGSNVGGLAGNNMGTITDSYWDTDTTGQASGVGSNAGTLTNVTGLTNAQARTQASYTGFDFTNGWVMFDDTRPFLRSEWSQTITNAHQLQLMGLNLGATYTLGRDIDASETASATGMWSAKGFSPVGSSTSRFTGGLDGRGRTVSALTINRPGQTEVGLFSYLSGTGRPARIANIGLAGGSVTASSNTGALVGYNDQAIIQASYATGSISGDSSTGGLIGTNAGLVDTSYAMGAVSSPSGASIGGLVGNNTGIVSGSYANGQVSGGTSVGGLVGRTGASTIVRQSHATGAVNGTHYVGGLVGRSQGTISASYATGAVTGPDRAGGLVGWAAGTILNSYATGLVAGTSEFGGLIGSNGASITNSYWDTNTTGQATGVGLNSGTLTNVVGYTTAQLQDSANAATTYTGFDFTNDWVTFDGTRPFLRAEWSRTVTNAHQLQLIALDLGASYTLGRDIDAGETASATGMWSAKGFSPVGNNTIPFTGKFDGRGQNISGLTLSRPAQSYVGLFGSVSGPTIRNVSLVGGATAGTTYVGSLIGYANGYLVQNAWSTGAVSGSTNVGGLIGLNNSVVLTSSATGTVTGSGTWVGGLAGYNSGAVRASYATGNVTGDNQVGGLLGANASGTVVASYATGAVTGTAPVTSAGGLIGTMQAGTIVRSSYATGAVSGVDRVGGLAGYNAGAIETSYATGLVSGTSNTGALVGYNHTTGAVTNSYWDTQTSGQAAGAGFNSGALTNVAGYSTAQLQDISSFATTYAGFDFANVWAPPNRSGQAGDATAHMPELYALSRVVAVRANDVAPATYGSAAPAFDAVRFGGYNDAVGLTGYARASETVSTAAILAATPLASSAALSTAGYAVVGTHTISATAPATVTSSAGTAYRVVVVPGSQTVTARALAVTATGIDRTYDGTTVATANLSDNRVSGDALSLAYTAAFADKNVGSGKAVAVSGIAVTGADAANYTFNTTASTTADITARALAVTATGIDRTYDGTTVATANLTDNRVAGDALSLAYGTASFADKNVGTAKAVAVSGIAVTGADAANYTSNTTASTTADIAARALAVTATGIDRTYDGTTVATANLSDNRVAGDTLSLAYGTAAFADKNVGSGKAVAVSGIAVTGADAANYIFNTTTSTTADITARALAVTANSRSKRLGESVSFNGTEFSASGLVAGDSVLSVLLASPGAAPSATVGTYAIAPSAAVGTGLANYAITYGDGTLAVTTTAITGTAEKATVPEPVAGNLRIDAPADPVLLSRTLQQHGRALLLDSLCCVPN